MDNWILCSKHVAHQGRGGEGIKVRWTTGYFVQNMQHTRGGEGRGTKLGGQLDTLFKTCSTPGEGRGTKLGGQLDTLFKTCSTPGEGRGTKLGGQLDTLFKTCSTPGEGRGGEQS